MGNTAPTNFPDSISIREGIPSPDGFSRLLRKLAKGDLLVESFSARLRRDFRGMTQMTWSTQKAYHAHSSQYASNLSHCFHEAIGVLIQADEQEGVLQGTETRRDRPVLYQT